ncbi:MAG: TonB-dependent receptor, partial [Bacteroides sp.]|nr:TonB-dependent receptor [Bacteroides sp.]
GLKVELFDGKLNGTLSYYDINVKDRVRTVAGTDGVTYSIQDGTQRSKGFEADLIANPIKGMHIILGYGYNDSKYTKGDPSIVGKHPYAIPHHIANFWVSHKFQHGVINGFGLGLGGNYSSDHFLDSDNKITVPGYFKLDATAFYEQTKYRISLKLNNLTDKEYWTSSFNATPQATRQFIANVTYRF